MPLLLITIGPSHYCEKARWALDRVGARYVEEKHAPMLHWRATLPHRRRTVPILVTRHGALTDSTDILKHLDQWVAEPDRLFPHDDALAREVAALEQRFDDALGPAVRRWAYAYLVYEPSAFMEVMAPGLGALEGAILRAGQAPLRTALRRAFKIRPGVAERQLDRIRGVFGEVGARIADGRRFLTGDRFTAADLTFAALASLAVAPPELPAPLPPLARFPEAMRKDIELLRATPAGELALRLYRDERGRRVAQTDA